ncbi:hypothetical protein Peetri_00027 [Pseudomonas phage vB_PpuM-Peetri]
MPDCFVVHADTVYGSPVTLKVFRRKYKAKLYVRMLKEYHALRPKMPSADNAIGAPYPESVYQAHLDVYYLDNTDWASSHPAGMVGEAAEDFTITQLPLE